MKISNKTNYKAVNIHLIIYKIILIKSKKKKKKKKKLIIKMSKIQTFIHQKKCKLPLLITLVLLKNKWNNRQVILKKLSLKLFMWQII